MNEAVYNIEFAQTLKKMSHMAPICKAVQPQRNIHEETEQTPTSDDMEEAEIPQINPSIQIERDHPMILKPRFEEQKIKQPVGENSTEKSIKAEDKIGLGFAQRVIIAQEVMRKEKAVSSFVEPIAIASSPKEFISIRNSVLQKHNLSEKNEEIRRLKNFDNKKNGEEFSRKDVISEEKIKNGIDILIENIKTKQLCKLKQEREDVHKIVDEMKKVTAIINGFLVNWKFLGRM